MGVTAKVTVTLEIDVKSSWGDECTVKQVKDQALTDANGVLNAALKDMPNIKLVSKLDCIGINYYNNSR